MSRAPFTLTGRQAPFCCLHTPLHSVSACSHTDRLRLSLPETVGTIGNRVVQQLRVVNIDFRPQQSGCAVIMHVAQCRDMSRRSMCQGCSSWGACSSLTHCQSKGASCGQRQHAQRGNSTSGHMLDCSCGKGMLTPEKQDVSRHDCMLAGAGKSRQDAWQWQALRR